MDYKNSTVYKKKKKKKANNQTSLTEVMKLINETVTGYPGTTTSFQSKLFPWSIYNFKNEILKTA